MNCNQGRPSGHVLASKPSSAFSTHSAGSATSATTSRSGGSRLLFGEIDTSSDRSSELHASVCSFVLCESSTFLKFWLENKCRDALLSHVETNDLASLRLACHDFSVRAAPALFNDLTITFRPSTFTKPAKLAALDRLGFYVKKLKFVLPHSSDTFLPPLVDPETGQELSFTYTPQVEAPTVRKPKYGDMGTTEILTRQWPTLFHAATNVPAFIRAFSAFFNLTRLTISCPGYRETQRYRRTAVDFALISLRIAIERNNLNALDSISLSPMHPGGILHLSPLLGYGATPRSASRWSRVRHLTIHACSVSPGNADGEPDLLKLLQTYIRNFQRNLITFNFRWVGSKGPMPIQRPIRPTRSLAGEHPSTRAAGTQLSPARSQSKTAPVLHFPNLRRAEFENMKATARDISAFANHHKRTIEEVNFEDIELASGSWDEALAPLTKLHNSRPRPSEDAAEIPIMLSPTLPTAMERIEVAQQQDTNERKSLRLSTWLSTRIKSKTIAAHPATTKKVRDGLLGCDGQLRKALRGSVFSRRNA